MFIVKPSIYIAENVPINEIGIVTKGISVILSDPKNKYITAATRAIASKLYDKLSLLKL